jgi:hypothetical protein
MRMSASDLRTMAFMAASSLALVGVVIPACQSHDFVPVDPITLAVNTTHTTVIGKQRPPNIMLVVDRSGSMVDSVSGTGPACTLDGSREADYDPLSPNPCKWNDLKNVFTDPTDGFLVQSQNIARFGLLALGAPSGLCAPGTILVPIGDDVQPIQEQIAHVLTPGGGTPTSSSLLNAANDPGLTTVERDRQHFIMLLTDGLPNCNPANKALCIQCRADPSSCSAPNGCRPTDPPFDTCPVTPFDGSACLDEDNLVNAIQQIRSSGIITFVIGFGQATTGPDANRVLNRAAEAGGHPRSGGGVEYYQANSVDELRQFLEEIVKPVPCSYTIDPQPSPGSIVSVTLHDSAGSGADIELIEGNDWSFTSGNDGVQLSSHWCDIVQNAPSGRYVVEIMQVNRM